LCKLFLHLAAKSALIFETQKGLTIEVYFMYDESSIRVFFSSKTVGGFKGRRGMEPVCHSCDKKLGKTNELTEVVPPEAMTLAFSAELAARELGIDIELIDVNRLTLVQRMNERLNGKPVPRISIGEEDITGSPTKDEIIELYRRTCDN
jgi:hypothetical protein